MSISLLCSRGQHSRKTPEAPISPVTNSRSRPFLHKHMCNLVKHGPYARKARHLRFESPLLGWAPIFMVSPPVSLFRYFIRPRYIYIARILAGYIWQCVPGHRVELIEKRQGKGWPTMKLRIFVRSKGHLCLSEFWILDFGWFWICDDRIEFSSLWYL